MTSGGIATVLQGRAGWWAQLSSSATNPAYAPRAKHAGTQQMDGRSSKAGITGTRSARFPVTLQPASASLCLRRLSHASSTVDWSPGY